ncbi:hypothetical protein Tco_1539154 [Tanacetum coccineum]
MRIMIWWKTRRSKFDLKTQSEVDNQNLAWLKLPDSGRVTLILDMSWVQLDVSGGSKTITTTAAQQVALDNSLVPLEKRVEIDKCNMRIDPAKTQKEPTYQVVLDALALTTFYLSFLITANELGHKGDVKSIIKVVMDQMYQPWRTFTAIINKCLSGKITGLDKLRLSRTQILWGMFYKKNVDFVELLWEDFTFQIKNRDHNKQEKMYYPRFTKVIIHHLITKDRSISMRNKMFMHTARDDSILGPMRFVSKSDDF